MNIVIEWDEEKNRILKQTRNISFEDVENLIINGKILDIVSHHNQKKYPHQKIFIIEINSYVYYVPFIEQKDKIFLKTIIPSRKFKENYEKN